MPISPGAANGASRAAGWMRRTEPPRSFIRAQPLPATPMMRNQGEVARSSFVPRLKADNSAKAVRPRDFGARRRIPRPRHQFPVRRIILDVFYEEALNLVPGRTAHAQPRVHCPRTI